MALLDLQVGFTQSANLPTDMVYTQRLVITAFAFSAWQSWYV